MKVQSSNQQFNQAYAGDPMRTSKQSSDIDLSPQAHQQRSSSFQPQQDPFNIYCNRQRLNPQIRESRDSDTHGPSSLMMQQQQVKMSPFAQTQQISDVRTSQPSYHPHSGAQSLQSRKPKQAVMDSNEDIDAKLRSLVTQVPQGVDSQVSPQTPQNRASSSHVKPNQSPQSAQRQPGSSGRESLQFFQPKFQQKGMLGPQHDSVRGRKTLMLDLDETLVHSQFKPVKKPDFIIPVDIEGRVCNIFVLKRPGVEYFLQQLSKYYEVVIYTASLSKYADPLMDKMDTGNWCSYRLFREHCSFANGVFVKDLSLCGRDLKDTIIVDNSPTSYMFQPECALPILSWYEDMKDRELYEMLPLLIEMSRLDDVREAIPKFVRNNQIDYNIAHRIVKSLNKNKPNDQEDSQMKSIDNKEEILKPKTSQSSTRESQKFSTVQPKMGPNNHQKIRSADMKPVINAWTNATDIAPINISKEASLQHKRQDSFLHNNLPPNQQNIVMGNAQIAAPPVTNITIENSIIYNFSLSPQQQHVQRDLSASLNHQQESQRAIQTSHPSRRPQTSKTNLLVSDSQEIRDSQPNLKESYNKKLNTLEILKTELQKEEALYNGDIPQSYSTKNSNHHKKRPQTGSVGTRVNNAALKTQKIDLSGQLLTNQQSNERRSQSGFNQKNQLQQKSSHTPKSGGGFSQTQKVAITNVAANQSKYYQQLIKANDFYQDPMAQTQLSPIKISQQNGVRGQDYGSIVGRHKPISNQHSMQPQLKIKPDFISPKHQSITPQNKKQRSYSSSNNNPRNNNHLLYVDGSSKQRNLAQNTPKGTIRDEEQYFTNQGKAEEYALLQSQQQDYLKQQQRGGQIALSEKYAAILNKNLEDTSNLAKTLKNTQAHLYDKLRQSHQNATQFINRDDYLALNSQGISPAQSKNHTNRFAPLNTTDKQLKLDYRGALSEYQTTTAQQHQGLFLNFSSSPQNNIYGSSIQNQRYSGNKGGITKPSTQASYRSSMAGKQAFSQPSSNGSAAIIPQQIPSKQKQGFEQTQKFDKNELSLYAQQQQQQQIMMGQYQKQSKKVQDLL